MEEKKRDVQRRDEDDDRKKKKWNNWRPKVFEERKDGTFRVASERLKTYLLKKGHTIEKSTVSHGTKMHYFTNDTTILKHARLFESLRKRSLYKNESGDSQDE